AGIRVRDRHIGYLRRGSRPGDGALAGGAEGISDYPPTGWNLSTTLLYKRTYPVTSAAGTSSFSRSVSANNRPRSRTRAFAEGLAMIRSTALSLLLLAGMAVPATAMEATLR